MDRKRPGQTRTNSVSARTKSRTGESKEELCHPLRACVVCASRHVNAPRTPTHAATQMPFSRYTGKSRPLHTTDTRRQHEEPNPHACRSRGESQCTVPVSEARRQGPVHAAPPAGTPGNTEANRCPGRREGLTTEAPRGNGLGSNNRFESYCGNYIFVNIFRILHTHTHSHTSDAGTPPVRARTRSNQWAHEGADQQQTHPARSPVPSPSGRKGSCTLGRVAERPYMEEKQPEGLEKARCAGPTQAVKQGARAGAAGNGCRGPMGPDRAGDQPPKSTHSCT